MNCGTMPAMQRCVDYLETRSDIDARKIAFWNDGTVQFGRVFGGLDERYDSVILVASWSACSPS
jgi:hypothetical protein